MTPQRRAAAAAGGLVALMVALAAHGFQPAPPGRAVLESAPARADGARAQYEHAEMVMKTALAKAHEYEHRAAQQQTLEKKDESMHYELVKAARDRADELRRQDRKVSKVADVRMRMQDTMRSTERVLALHERRLEDLMAEQRTADVKAKRDQEDADDLQHSAHAMAASVQRLEAQTADMKKQFKVEEKDSRMTKANTVCVCARAHPPPRARHPACLHAERVRLLAASVIAAQTRAETHSLLFCPAHGHVARQTHKRTTTQPNTKI